MGVIYDLRIGGGYNGKCITQRINLSLCGSGLCG